MVAGTRCGRGHARAHGEAGARLRARRARGGVDLNGALADRLELLLVTYNRAALLDRTLGQLAKGPFAGCRLTVLDNHSTDSTPQVCEKYERRFERMTVVRHTLNIGASPNYLRAVELSRSPFTWILADDDTFDFSVCDDVIEAIDSDRFDLISVGAPGQYDWERGLATTTKELLRRGARYFHVYTFVPGLIFRTERFDSNCVALGYRNVPNMYPQFEFVLRALERDFPVYTSRLEIVRRNMDEQATSLLRWYAAWARSCATVEDRSLRRRALYDTAEDPIEWTRQLVARIAYERRLHPERVAGEMRDLLVHTVGVQRLIVLALVPAAFLPPALYRALASVWRRATGRRGDGAGMADELRI